MRPVLGAPASVEVRCKEYSPVIADEFLTAESLLADEFELRYGDAHALRREEIRAVKPAARRPFAVRHLQIIIHCHIPSVLLLTRRFCDDEGVVKLWLHASPLSPVRLGNSRVGLVHFSRGYLCLAQIGVPSENCQRAARNLFALQGEQLSKLGLALLGAHLQGLEMRRDKRHFAFVMQGAADMHITAEHLGGGKHLGVGLRFVLEEVATRENDGKVRHGFWPLRGAVHGVHGLGIEASTL